MVPPSITNSVPVIAEARSDATKATSSATSCGLFWAAKRDAAKHGHQFLPRFRVAAVVLEQLEAVRAGQLDAGFIYGVTKSDRELDQIQVGMHGIALGVPKGHPLTKLTRVRLRDLVGLPFILFPRRESPAFYDRLMNECYRGGLKSPRVVQEARNEATILSLVSHGMGVGFTNETARWRCPEGVVILSVADLKMPLPLALVWRKDNLSPLLAQFTAEVRSLPDVQRLAIR